MMDGWILVCFFNIEHLTKYISVFAYRKHVGTSLGQHI